ncbi:MAG: thiamine phosphate synthase [Syntrophomonadaceae bacterium]|jgi:thiamine-phosphate pyrophosphorylase
MKEVFLRLDKCFYGRDISLFLKTGSIFRKEAAALQRVNRILDANINRAAEGLRVLEDTARFCFNAETLTRQLKLLRHRVRKISDCSLYLDSRDTNGDIGPKVSDGLGLEGKQNICELVTANFKRVQEALRSIEESCRILDKSDLATEYENIRYSMYSLEKDYIKLLSLNKNLKAFESGIYGMTAEEHSRGRNNPEVVKQMLDAGIKIIQYREKNMSMLEKYRQCMRIRELTSSKGAVFIINDHIDLAVIIGADGVHLGQDDIPVNEARRILGENKIIGVSVHSPQQAQRAISDGADYIGVGPIYKTYTKKDVCDPVGISYLDYVVKNHNIPFVAIGGIKSHNLPEVIQHGATCFALVTELAGAIDIKAKVAEIKEIMKGENLK